MPRGVPTPKESCSSCGLAFHPKELIDVEILDTPTRICEKDAKSYKGKSWFRIVEAST